MRLVIDLQGAQTPGSRHRGIGRYSSALARTMARNDRGHELVLALNGSFGESIDAIRSEFAALLPREQIRVWTPVTPAARVESSNAWRADVSEVIREAFLQTLKPDVVHVASLFEGLTDDGVASIGRFTSELPTAATLYDLIPLVHRDIYLSDPRVALWYESKLGHLRRAELLLSISESSRREAIDLLGLPCDQVVNISTAADPQFMPVAVPPPQERALRERYGLRQPFLMYTGGIDHRKNIDGLIKAYARLPGPLRAHHQLAIVCSIDDMWRHRLQTLAGHQGLAQDEVVFTGFVPEADLVALYNLCHAFVFPSWHEGFGLPALEAMSCGAAVIASNTSSLPEVVARADALFDPRDEEGMARLMSQVLENEAFRSALQGHALEQARRFSWEACADRALDALEELHRRRSASGSPVVEAARVRRRPTLAYVSPLPPVKSGIAAYSADLLPELSRHYAIDVVVDQPEVTDTWVRANCTVRSATWFAEHAHRYDRIVYHFGNSSFHHYMFELLDKHPGIVVLHDVYLGGTTAQLDVEGRMPNRWAQELYRSHGYRAIRDRYHQADSQQVIDDYPCNASLLERAHGVIVHSAHAGALVEPYVPGRDDHPVAVVPLLRKPAVPARQTDRLKTRSELALGRDQFVVCSFGLLGPNKLNERLLEAWLQSPLAADPRCVLVFAGENDPGPYGQALAEQIRLSGRADRIRITGWLDNADYERHLIAADAAVQLRTKSRGETSAAVLDCLNHGLPTIVNAHGSLNDLPGKVLVKLPDDFTVEQLSASLVRLYEDEAARTTLSSSAQAYVREAHSPRASADRYATAIEAFSDWASTAAQGAIHQIAQIEGIPETPDAWVAIAGALGRSLPTSPSQRQLLVDISVLVQVDAKSGIQRVVRSVLLELLSNPPEGWRVEPVYYTAELGFQYARGFTLGFLECPLDALDDQPIDTRRGDLFFVLDLQPAPQPGQEEAYAALRRSGVAVYFTVYDLLPLEFPDYFPRALSVQFRQWFSMVAQADGALCISRSVADMVIEKLREMPSTQERRFDVGYFHLGSDILSSKPSRGLPAGFEDELSFLARRPTILCVGTIEPRKGYRQVLDAFELLWQRGEEVCLAIVGKRGWGTDDIVERLEAHPEAGRRLRWYPRLSDEALLKLYPACSGVLVASEGEGFGLPVVEAMRHGKPVLVRDLPVFREVGGEAARYFRASDGGGLADDLMSWLRSHSQEGSVSSGSAVITWEESVGQLVQVLTQSQWYRQFHSGSRVEQTEAP
jgi:glycosyltransferase involved in cell wall biosynthesis